MKNSVQQVLYNMAADVLRLTIYFKFNLSASYWALC